MRNQLHTLLPSIAVYLPVQYSSKVDIIFIMGCVSWMMYEERTGRTPLSITFWKLVSHVPGLKALATKKLEVLSVQEDSVVQQVNSSMFHGDPVAEETVQAK